MIQKVRDWEQSPDSDMVWAAALQTSSWPVCWASRVCPGWLTDTQGGHPARAAPAALLIPPRLGSLPPTVPSQPANHNQAQSMFTAPYR